MGMFGKSVGVWVGAWARVGAGAYDLSENL